MNIAVTTRLLLDNNMTGVGWFTFETIRRVVEKHPEHTFYYLFDRPYDPKFITSNNIIPIIIKPKCRFHPIFYHLWYEILIPRVLKKHKIDLFLSCDGILSLSTKVPTVLTVHDLAFEHFPQFIPNGMSKYLRKVTPKFANKALFITAVSEYTKKDIVERYHINPDKITVVYNGTNQSFRAYSEKEKELIQKEYAENNPFFLFLGTIHPRKNLKNQLLAYDSFRKNNPALKHKFLVVGNRWIWGKEMNEIYNSMTFKSDVIFIGHLPTDKLVALMASATALMYVSIFEGFGIPIIEAFETETPVITSNTSSMAEIAGDAALTVDPYNIDEIAKAMSSIVIDKEKTASLVSKGKERKSFFSWDKTASLFDSVLCKSIDEINKNH